MRVGWVDSARGIGIVLVVIGHALAGLRGASLLPQAEPWLFAHRWIYAFHMPLFFFLSGLFLPDAGRLRLGPFLGARLRTVAWPYLVWSVGQTLVQVATGAGANQRLGWDALGRIAYQPVMQFWFLYVLLAMLALYAVLVRAGLTPGGVAVVAAFLYVAPRLVPLGPWGVPYALATHFVYFAAGAALASRLLPAVASLPATRALSAATAGFALMSGAVVAAGPGAGWWSVPVAVLGIASALALGRALVGSAWLGEWGRLSLQIFVAHTLASAGIRMVLARGLHWSDPSLHVAAGIAAGVFAPVWLARLAERRGWRYLYSWPAQGTR